MAAGCFVVAGPVVRFFEFPGGVDSFILNAHRPHAVHLTG